MPLITRATVVLPAPLAPRRATTSPGATVKLTSLMARKWPYPAETPSRVSNGGPADGARMRSAALTTSSQPVPR